MITLRVNPYNKQELDTLALLLGKATEHLYSTCDENCKMCRLKYLCYDLEHALQHAVKLATEREIK